MSKGHGFESRHHILDGHDIFFTLICCKKLYCLFEKIENKRKSGRGLPIFQKNSSSYHATTTALFSRRNYDLFNKNTDMVQVVLTPKICSSNPVCTFYSENILLLP